MSDDPSRMDGAELKALRNILGWSQKQLADGIGVTATFIGMMERGAKPIEKRTALAIRYLVMTR